MGDKKPTKRQQTHQRMLEAASQSFRSKGYAGIGVDGIAKMAGVTSGAFYAHFGSKDGAFHAALEAGLDEVIETIPKLQQEYGSTWIQVFMDYYLGRTHRKDLACGCAMATLTSEVMRADIQMHAVYETRMKKIAALIANGLKGNSQAARFSRAWALLGLLTGGLNMARAVKTGKASDEIAAAVHAAASIIAGETIP